MQTRLTIYLATSLVSILVDVLTKINGSDNEGFKYRLETELAPANFSTRSDPLASKFHLISYNFYCFVLSSYRTYWRGRTVSQS